MRDWTEVTGSVGSWFTANLGRFGDGMPALGEADLEEAGEALFNSPLEIESFLGLWFATNLPRVGVTGISSVNVE